MKHTVIFMILILTSWYTRSQSSIDTLLNLEGYYQHLSGNVLVKTDTGQIFKSIGLADNDQKIPNDRNLPSDIGSISKQFTAAAILHLVHEGKVNLQGPINDYLGPYASKRWSKIKVHQMLVHSSGIPSLYQNDKGMEHFLPDPSYIDRDSLVSFFRNKKLLFKPGKEYRYSNSGYILLALIIETVTGVTYEQYLESELFEVYGLTSTTVGPPEDLTFIKPHFGYLRDMTESAPLMDFSWMRGAGGIYSTVDDLSHWMDLINSDSFLTKELRTQFFGKHVRTRRGFYGYGWEVSSDHKIQHDGSNFGYISYLGYDQKSKNQVIILTNQTFAGIEFIGQSSKSINKLKDNIWLALAGESVSIDLPEPGPAAFLSGHYVFNDSVSISIVSESEGIFVHQKGNVSPVEMIHRYPLQGSDTLEQRLQRIATALEKKKFRGLKEDCDKQMKVAVKLGLISLGYKMITSDVGKIHSVSPYYVNDNHGLLRLSGSQGEMDLIVYFDAEGLMQGLFEQGVVTPVKIRMWKMEPTSEGELFLDGFPYGATSFFLRQEGDQLKLRQYDREFVGKVSDIH